LKSRVLPDLSRGHAYAWVLPDMISQRDETIGTEERQRSKKDAFDERENSGCRADAKRERQDDRHRESWTLDQLPQGVSEIPEKGMHRP
jgi:hypothetical protein